MKMFAANHKQACHENARIKIFKSIAFRMLFKMLAKF